MDKIDNFFDKLGNFLIYLFVFVLLFLFVNWSMDYERECDKETVKQAIREDRLTN